MKSIVVNNRFHIASVVLIMLACAVASSCSRHAGELSSEEYIAYVNDPKNGLIVSREAGDFLVELQYKPLDYELLMEMGEESGDTTGMELLKKEIGQMQYYVLRIGSKDKKSDMLATDVGSKDDYFNRIGYLSSGIQQNIRLIDGKDTLSCLLHHFERNYKLSSYSNIILAFDANEHNEANDKTLVLDDEVFGIGRLKLTIDKSAIQKIPALRL